MKQDDKIRMMAPAIGESLEAVGIKSGWISIKDKLPEEGKYIVACGVADRDDFPAIELGFRTANDIVPFMEEGQFLDFYFEVTHWIAIPDVPGDLKNKETL